MKVIIEKVIGDFLASNNFVAIKQNEYSVDYSNGLCNLHFFEEYASIYLFISYPRFPENEYHFGIVVFVLLGESMKTFSEIFDNKERQRAQLLNYINYLSRDLKYIVIGDFTWIDKYDAYTKQQKELMEEVHKLPRNHVIFQKYLKGDVSWKVDLLNSMQK